MKKVKRLPPRSSVKPADTWDLARLFPSDQAWEHAFSKWEKRLDHYARFRGRLAQGPKTLAACLKFDLGFDRAAERLRTYAFLKTAEDATADAYQRMQGRLIGALSRAGQAASFIRPEILAIPAARMRAFLRAGVLAPYKILLQRVLRFKPHTLGRKEEHLLAMQTEMAQAARQVFQQLNDADLKFGDIRGDRGQWIELQPCGPQHAASLAQAERPPRRLPSILSPVRRSPTYALRGPGRLDPVRRLITPAPADTAAAWRPRCSPTTCRCPSTTT